MRILTILSALFVLSIIFLTGDALSEKFEYTSLTISKDETVVFDGDSLWIEGDILIDGDLTIKNSHINVNRSLDWTISELRINSTGKLYLENTTITTEGDMNGGKLTTFKTQLSAIELYRDSLLSELNQSNSTIERDNLTQLLSDANSSILFLSDNINAFTTYTLVSNAGNLSIYNSTIYYGMIWLVGGNASITDLSLDGYGMPNYGIFSEDTNLVASGVSIRNYTLGLRAIGSSPTLNSVFYYNCSTQMTQEWWVTFSPVEESTDLPITGFEIRQWDDGGNMLGTWNWAKQYEVNSEGQMISHTANFTSYLNLGFGYIDDQWEQQITDNTEMIRYYNMNISHITYESAVLFVDGILWTDTTQKAPKWSEINVSVNIDNPTDLNFNNVRIELSINSVVMRSGGFNLLADSSFRSNLTWRASIEGPLSLQVNTTVVDYSDDSAEDMTIALSKFIHVQESTESSKESGSWIALMAIFVILSISSYIIYSGIENETESEDSNPSDEEIEGDDVLREMALPQETEEEKEN